MHAIPIRLCRTILTRKNISPCISLSRNGQDTDVFLPQIDRTGTSRAHGTTAFTSPELHPDKLLSRVRLVHDRNRCGRDRKISLGVSGPVLDRRRVRNLPAGRVTRSHSFNVLNTPARISDRKHQETPSHRQTLLSLLHRGQSPHLLPTS